MSDALKAMIENGSTPTPGGAMQARPNPALMTVGKGDITNARSFRDARMLDEEAERNQHISDPELAPLVDFDDMMRVVNEEMAKLLPPSDVAEVWKKKVEAGEFRTWMQKKHRPARFPIADYIGKLSPSLFRQHLRNTVIGTQGGSILGVVKNQQYNGTWEPYDYYAWRGTTGGGTTTDMESGKVVGVTPPTHQLFLHVQFVEITGAEPITYDAKGEPNVDYAAGGEAMREIATLVREMKHKVEKAEDRAVASENAELRALVESLAAKVAALSAPAAQPPEESGEVREHHKTREARLRREAEEAAAKAKP